MPFIFNTQTFVVKISGLFVKFLSSSFYIQEWLGKSLLSICNCFAVMLVEHHYTALVNCLMEMNSTKVHNPRRVNELYIHWNPTSHLMENCEELAQPEGKLEKHREPLRLLNNSRTFATALPIAFIKNACS